MFAALYPTLLIYKMATEKNSKKEVVDETVLGMLGDQSVQILYGPLLGMCGLHGMFVLPEAVCQCVHKKSACPMPLLVEIMLMVTIMVHLILLMSADTYESNDKFILGVTSSVVDFALWLLTYLLCMFPWKVDGDKPEQEEKSKFV